MSWPQKWIINSYSRYWLLLLPHKGRNHSWREFLKWGCIADLICILIVLMMEQFSEFWAAERERFHCMYTKEGNHLHSYGDSDLGIRICESCARTLSQIDRDVGTQKLGKGTAWGSKGRLSDLSNFQIIVIFRPKRSILVSVSHANVWPKWVWAPKAHPFRMFGANWYYS